MKIKHSNMYRPIVPIQPSSLLCQSKVGQLTCILLLIFDILLENVGVLHAPFYAPIGKFESE